MKVGIVILAIVIGLVGGYFLFQKMSTTPSNQPSSNQTTISTTPEGFCSPSQLQGTVDPNPGAGNVYATVTLTNTSQNACKVIGNNTLSIDYPNSVTNFQIAPQQTASTDMFTLEPNQSIYSLIHYPNGPQCSSQTTGVDTGVSYNISQTETFAFTITGSPTLTIPTCNNSSEITTIDVYPFSQTEVTP